MNAIDMARYVIQKSADTDRPITNLKLQKILYYIQGYSYRQLSEPAFSDPIYKWPYGPVVPTVYFAYNSNRANSIYQMDDTSAEPIKILRAHEGIKTIVDRVDAACKGKSSTELVSMTHLERPWIEAAESDEIKESAIQAYFSNHNPLGIAELEQ